MESMNSFLVKRLSISSFNNLAQSNAVSTINLPLDAIQIYLPEILRPVALRVLLSNLSPRPLPLFVPRMSAPGLYKTCIKRLADSRRLRLSKVSRHNSLCQRNRPDNGVRSTLSKSHSLIIRSPRRCPVVIRK